MNPITPARSLDLRSLPTWDRHARIFAAFDELRDATVLTVISDHEPRPLRLQFEQRHSDEFVRDQRHLGIARWEVSLRRAPPIPGRRLLQPKPDRFLDPIPTGHPLRMIEIRTCRRHYRAHQRQSRRG